MNNKKELRSINQSAPSKDVTYFNNDQRCFITLKLFYNSFSLI